MCQEKGAWTGRGALLDEKTAKKQRRESHRGPRRLIFLHFQKLFAASF
jgi:hypothetical protein